jgi:predicted regulator of Ras-like GTPase activity (Roadblock/LC7/MglB family)
MTQGNPISGSQALNQLLSRLNQEGGFSISVLTDSQGLSLAFATSPGMDADIQSAVVAQVQKTALQAGRQLGMTGTDEIVLNDTQGQRLVCRPFSVNDHHLILALMVPSKAQTYRLATNKAIRDIRQIWSSYWE